MTDMICKNCGRPVVKGEIFGPSSGLTQFKWVHAGNDHPFHCYAKTVAEGIPAPTKQCPTCHGEGKVRI